MKHKLNAWLSTFAFLIVFHVGFGIGACNHDLATAQTPPQESPTMQKTPFNESANAPSKQGSLFIGNTDITVQMQAEFKAAEYLTVQFDVIPPSPAAPSFGVFDAVADVSFTVAGGGTVRRTVSIGSGTTVSGPGQNCNVRMRDQSSGAFGPGTEYTVMAQVAPGAHPTAAAPPTLRGFPTVVALPAAGTVVLNIPPDAGVTSAQVTVSVLAAAALPVQAVVLQKNLPGQILKQYDPNIQTTFVAIAPNATQIEVDNLNGANAYRVQITWGIDG